MTASSAKGSRVRGGSAIAVAMGVMNITTYGYTILAARVLGPRAYGAFASLMGLLLVVMVVSLSLQATAARRIAATPRHVHQIEALVLRVGMRASLGLTLVCLVLSPAINVVLRLDSLPTVLVTALAAAPLTMMGAQAGILQGERRWVPLSMIYVAAGLPRLAFGAAALAWRPDEFWAMVAVAIAALAPVVVGWHALRTPREEGEPSEEHSTRTVWHEMAHNANALLAFFALSNADILVARNVLDPHEAGLYAGGLILVKAVLFLPQFIVVLAFPSMATSARVGVTSALRASMAAIAGLGCLVALGVAVLPGLAVIFVGGNQYAAIQDNLWVFALLGTVLALLQLLIYNLVAQQSRRAVIVVWVALVALAVIGRVSNSFEQLLLIVLAIDATLLTSLLVLNLLGTTRRLPPPGLSVSGGVPARPGADGDVEVNGEGRG
jgi:O-antigen/teichoic acid export membrane protein